MAGADRFHGYTAGPEEEYEYEYDENETEVRPN
jgi:hypothetical protein